MPNQQTPQRQSSHQKPASNTRRVNHMSQETVVEEPKVMLGTFDVHSTPTTILCDSRASHSFISQAFIRTHSIPLCAMKNSILVNSTGGSILKWSRFSSKGKSTDMIYNVVDHESNPSHYQLSADIIVIQHRITSYKALQHWLTHLLHCILAETHVSLSESL
jgi:hypothetical protein